MKESIKAIVVENMKVSLKLKHFRRLIASEIHENFGYCPSNEYFDKLYDEMNNYIDSLNNDYAKIIEQHDKLLSYDYEFQNKPNKIFINKEEK